MSELSTIIDFLKDRNELPIARELLSTFAKYAGNIEQYDELAKCYHDIKQYPLAKQYAEKCLVMAPNNEVLYSVRANLAKLCNHMNDPEKSLFYLELNNKITPDVPEILLEKVFALFLLNRKKESEGILRFMLSDSYQHSLDENIINRIKFNLGTYDLYAGKFQQGLYGFLIIGKKLGIWKDITLPFTFWDGGIRPNEDLLIVSEGGIGDEVINIRFMDKIKSYGMNPIWFTTRKDLAEVFNRNGYNTITDLKDLKQKPKYWTYAMSLPVYLDLTEKDLWNGPYLKASNPKFKLPYSQVKQGKKEPFKIGIRWSGNPEYEQDLHRTLPLKDLYFSILESCPGADIYSLQKDHCVEDLLSFDNDIINLEDRGGLDNWEETINVIKSLDLIITSCTSIAHISAALGKKTYILVPLTAYYTWASTTDQSTIWYGDNVKILRQVKHKSWIEPLQELKELLHVII